MHGLVWFVQPPLLAPEKVSMLSRAGRGTEGGTVPEYPSL